MKQANLTISEPAIISNTNNAFYLLFNISNNI